MPLMPLAFGNQIAKRYTDLTKAADAMSEVLPSLTLMDAGRSEPFRAKTAICRFGDLRLMANSQSASQMHVEETGGWHLVVPVAGVAAIECDRYAFSLSPGCTSLLLPNIRRSTKRSLSSAVVVSFNLPKLERTLAAMSGAEARVLGLDERPRTIQPEPVTGLFPAFLTICRQIDLALKHPGLVDVLGLEDVIFRWMATGIASPQDDDPLTESSRSRLDVVCDLICCSIERPLTLTEMEIASGLSARALQYAFKARFGCSPMAWQRRERMLKAQQLLLVNAHSHTIASVAHDMGFSSAAAFSTLYKLQFGETPSQTLNRVKR